MEVTLKTTEVHTIDINAEEAFRILCKTLYMDFVMYEDSNLHVNDDGEVWLTENGHNTKIDDRGDLFIALRNVAVNMFPNLMFRNASYIYNNESTKE